MKPTAHMIIAITAQISMLCPPVFFTSDRLTVTFSFFSFYSLNNFLTYYCHSFNIILTPVYFHPITHKKASHLTRLIHIRDKFVT